LRPFALARQIVEAKKRDAAELRVLLGRCQV
jgi:hypothetical protein